VFSDLCELIGPASYEFDAPLGDVIYFYPRALPDFTFQDSPAFQGIEEGVDPAVAHGDVESLEDDLDDVISTEGLLLEEGQNHAF